MDIDTTSNEEVVTQQTIVPLQTLSATSFVGEGESNRSIELSDAFELLVNNSNSNIKVCKIENSYDDYIMIMINKLDNMNKLVESNNKIIDADSHIIVIDSYDGAQHRRTQKDRTNIVSFSSQMITLQSIKAGYSTAVSKNILTWQQMIGAETYANLIPVLDSVYNRKIHNKNLRIQPDCKLTNDNTKLTLYDLHDGKM